MPETADLWRCTFRFHVDLYTGLRSSTERGPRRFPELSQQFVGRHKEGVLLEDPTDDDHWMSPHNVNNASNLLDRKYICPG